MGLLQVTKLCLLPKKLLSTCFVVLELHLRFGLSMTFFSACRRLFVDVDLSVVWRSLSYCDWVSRRLNPVRLLVGPSLALFGGLKTYRMLCGRGEGWGPSLFARIVQRSEQWVYLLSSGLCGAVKLFTNCKGTTVPYFLLCFSLPMDSLAHLCYLYQLENIISYTSYYVCCIVKENKK